ncbi:hypothetical protein ACHWQZ_G007581 [Mnemiopsis leidyi]
MIEGVGLLPYSERLQILQLTTLAERRSRGDLIEVYKASQGLCQLAGVFNFSRSGLNLVCKPVHLRLQEQRNANFYTKYSFCITNSSKDSVIRSLTRRAYNIGSPQHLNSGLQTVRHICLLNGFPSQRMTLIMEEFFGVDSSIPPDDRLLTDRLLTTASPYPSPTIPPSPYP